MKGLALGPGGEYITWPDQVAPRGRMASSTRKIKPQTSNLCCRPSPTVCVLCSFFLRAFLFFFYGVLRCGGMSSPGSCVMPGWFVDRALWGVVVRVAVAVVPQPRLVGACVVLFCGPWLCLCCVACCLPCGCAVLAASLLPVSVPVRVLPLVPLLCALSCCLVVWCL